MSGHVGGFGGGSNPLLNQAGQGGESPQYPNFVVNLAADIFIGFAHEERFKSAEEAARYSLDFSLTFYQVAGLVKKPDAPQPAEAQTIIDE